MFYAVKITSSKIPKETELTDQLRRKDTKDEDNKHNIVIDITYRKIIKDEKDVKEGESKETDNLENILTEAEALVADAAEYRIDYHICRHDEDIHSPCGNWQTGREKKAVKK